MKLIKKLLTLGLGLGLVGGALVGVKESKVEANAIDYETYIPMEAAFFTNWTDAAGSFSGANSTFWGENYHFQNLDTFYRGETAEGWTGTLTSRTWKQHTQYIYFQIGGAKNYDVTGDAVHLKIYYGNAFSVFYNDTFLENPMILRGFKIPDAAYASLMSDGDDFDMYIEILDQQTADYGFVNFGYLHVNQTLEQVSDAMRYYINRMDLNDREWEVNKRKQILHNYYLNDSLKEFFYSPINDISDGFESNSDFLNHWYFDFRYGNGANWGLHFDKAIGFDSYRPDDNTRMPFNKTGNGFFRGWFENDDLGGFVGGDNSIYRFISRPFILSGTGLVSIKMAGTASLHVIDTQTRQDLVWADLLTFNSSGDQVNLANSNFNTVTMVRHVINLEAYLGRNIQLAIADISDGGWSALYVDELVTNYSSYPAFKVDAFTQTNNNGTFNAYRTDKYINSTVFNGETNPTGLKYVLESEINQANENEIINHVDNSPAKEAYDFLQNYYGTLRSPNNEFDYSKVNDETQSSIVSAYNLLSNNAKAIVNASTDIEYKYDYVSDWWSHPVDTSKTISVAFADLINKFATYTVSFDANGGTGTMEDVVRGEGSIYPLPANGFTAPDGKQFAGWTVGSDATLRQPGYEITISGDVTITAQWEDIPVVNFTISFNANGGTGTMADVVRGEGSIYPLPANGFTEPEGYEFAGWTVGSDATLRQPGYEITVTGDVTVTAQWSLIPIVEYTITFDANGGSGSMAPVVKEEGQIYPLPANGFTEPEGYEFAGWKVGSDDTLRQPGYEITVTADVTVTAQWSLIPVVEYTITFDANGGSGTMASVVKQEGSKYNLPANGFTAPEGYEFAGWKVGSDETLRQPGYEITVTADVKVTAQWKLIPVVQYTVSFDANGGTGTMESLTVNRGEQITLPQCTFVAPEGKEFDYWLISSVKYQPGEKITIVGDTAIKASWKNVEQEQPKEDEEEEGKKSEQEQQEDSPFMVILKKVYRFVKKVFEKIVQFIENLLA